MMSWRINGLGNLLVEVNIVEASIHLILEMLEAK